MTRNECAWFGYILVENVGTRSHEIKLKLKADGFFPHFTCKAIRTDVKFGSPNLHPHPPLGISTAAWTSHLQIHIILCFRLGSGM